MPTRTARPAVRRGEVIPDFTLPGASGNSVSNRSYYLRRNLVIVFLPADSNDRWRNWVSQFVEAMLSVPDSDTQVFLITPGDQFLATLEEHLTPTANITALADRNGRVAGRFGHDGEHGLLVVTDRFGVIFHLAAEQPDAEELDPTGIPGWIEFIACQCS